MKVIQNKPFLPPYAEYIEKIKSCWDSYYLSNCGPIEKEFAQELENRGLCNPNLVVNGHAALELSLDALNIKGEVITTPFTFISTTNAIVRRGFKPVFADIDKDTFNILPSSIEGLINENTVAILAVHVFGVPCDVDQLQRIADRHGVKLIYDAAHAFGVTVKGKDISNYGDMSIFSFHATKLFHSIEGGVVCTNDEMLAQNISNLRNFGINGGSVDYCGMNAKMHEFSAAMGVVNLGYVDEVIKKRKYIFQRYQKNLIGLDGVKLQNRNSIEKFHDNYAYFPVVVSPEIDFDRDHVFNILKEKGVEARKYFYPLTSDAAYLNHESCADVPVARSVSESILTLPLHYHLSDDDVDYVSQVVFDVFDG